jgi:hypothetical protein
MDNKDLNLQAEKLKMQGEMLDIVEEWWAQLIGLKISEYNFLKEKLLNKWDEITSNRMNQLEKDIEHLQKKSNWEQKEIFKYKETCHNFEKIQEKLKLIEFSKNLNKINKRFNK